MKTKNKIALLVTLTLFFYSCSNDNNTKRPTYTSLEDLTTAVDSLYYHLRQNTKFTSFFIASWGGDDITTTAFSAKADFRATDSRELTENMARPEHTWKSCYARIIEANNIILNSEELQDISSSELKMMLGEAYFIRGFLYHHLIRNFGEAVIQLDKTIDSELPLSSTTEVYQLIENDFLKAEEFLPAIYPNIPPGATKPNSGTARAFLARLYLDWAGFPVKDISKYNLAATSAKKVMDNHNSHGFDLLDDFKNLWKINYRYNEESVFTIDYCLDCATNGNHKTSKIGIPLEFNGWGETYGEIKFFETFPDSYRKEATYIENIPVDDPFEIKDGTTKNWKKLNQTNLVIAKITGYGDIPRVHNTNRNDFLMRYAEVLLIFAEASARNGSDTPEAWEALNKVRRRAHFLPVNTPNNIIDITSGDLAEIAFTEKGWELAGEYLRWFDLVRTEQVANFLNNDYRNDIISDDTNDAVKETNQIIGTTTPDNYFFPHRDYKDWYFYNN